MFGLGIMKLPRSPIALVGVIIWAVVSCTSYPSRVWSQPSRPINDIPSSGRWRWREAKLSRSESPPQAKLKKPDFSAEGRPGSRKGGGSRSPCQPKKTPLTALMPVTNWGKTVASRPTFWFYVPYSPQEASSGEFVLQDEERNDVFRTSFTLPGTPGFVSLSIPPTAAPLEINKLYRWYFKLYCQPQKLSAPVFVQGWVQRSPLTPELESQLKATTPRDYIAYATNLVWYDALARLAELRLTKPPNATLEQDWADLLSLRGIGLEHLNRKPIVGNAILLYQRPGAD